LQFAIFVSPFRIIGAVRDILQMLRLRVTEH
jgi:hypothetical protein